MSRAIASARQRRAGITPEIPPPPPTQQSVGQGQGLTLPQVISLVDARLIKLEKFVKESKELSQNQPQINQPLQVPVQVPQFDISIIEEFNSRFDLLAQELMDLKNVVLKLQSYTMDVNKMLLEEREEVPTDNVFTMQNLQLSSEKEVEFHLEPESIISEIPEIQE